MNDLRYYLFKVRAIKLLDGFGFDSYIEDLYDGKYIEAIIALLNTVFEEGIKTGRYISADLIRDEIDKEWEDWLLEQDDETKASELKKSHYPT
jgi:hypothetical protein